MPTQAPSSAAVTGAVVFPPRSEFFKVLKTRVDAYFTAQQCAPSGDWRLYRKTLFAYALMIGAYCSLVWGVETLWATLFAAFVLAQGYILAAFNVMHDGAHGSFAKKTWVNWLAGATMDVIGSSQMLWKQKHNQLHHTYPNIDGKDDDIQLGALMRLSPNQAWRPWHRWQAFYATLLYSLLTLYLGLFGDFYKLITGRIGNTPLQKGPWWEIPWFCVHKLSYLGYTLVLPSFFHPFWQVFSVFIGVHLVFGLTLSLVFQLAHVVEGAGFPLPADGKQMPLSWSEHQLHTTADFAHGNRLASFYMGGLNFQIEHHLFHRISHVHYPAIAQIVRGTCEDFSIPYLCFPSVRAAIAAHFRLLHRLGQRPANFV